MSQISFGEMEYTGKKKLTRREIFLHQMDEILPWKEFTSVIRRYYPKIGNGRQPYKLEVMLRIYFMQQWYGLSDPSMEDSLYDVTSMRRFAGIGINEIPDESTILRFRHLLERHDISTKLFVKAQTYMEKHQLILSKGTIVDATIISAPSSTKNKKRERDPEMKSTKKGNQYYFGMKVHIGTDTRGRAHSVVVTDASVHDSQCTRDLLHGEEEEVYGDKAFADEARKQEMEAKGVTWRVSRKARRGRKLNCADRAFNKKSNRTRAKVEHLFGVIKHLWGYRKVKYKGINKNAAQAITLVMLANFYMARKEIAVL